MPARASPLTTIGVLWLSVNNITVLGAAGDNRVEFFQAALAEAGLPPARLITYHHILDGTFDLTGVDLLRIESPGRDVDLNQRLVALGAQSQGIIPPPTPAERGTLLHNTFWYMGFATALEWVRCALPNQTRTINPPADILLMFDKPRCKNHLAAYGIPVPRILGVIAGFDDLMAQMRQTGLRRVFVKLNYGSSASGIVAFRTDDHRMQAFTTVELGSDGQLYNTRRIQQHAAPRSIAHLIDALAEYGTFAEQWLPKAGHDGHTFDLRVVMIDGEVRHRVVRLSRSPMTNLHLLNARLPYEALALPHDVTEALHRTCERVAAAFPRSLYMGIDVMLTPGYRQHAVLEVNAFGDLLKGITDRGQSTYEAEVACL